jgi:hypothetical protein
MVTRARPKTVSYNTAPRYTLQGIATKWLWHNGLAYCVQAAPDLIIRQVVKDRVKEAMVKQVLRKHHLDIVDRWYVLCECNITLYASQEEAQHVRIAR